MGDSARDQIFGAIRKARGREPLDDGARTAVDSRIAQHQRNTVLSRAALPHAGQVALFVEMAEAVAASVGRVDTLADVPAAVADWLKGHNLPPSVRLAPDTSLTSLTWQDATMLEVSTGAARADDLTSVTGALAGVAETGTLIMPSGAAHPTTLGFLPDNHIVVLRESQIVGHYEDAWDQIRAAGSFPRTDNMVTGPSRTGDIEQIIQLGAHGPRRLHIILVGQGDA